MSTNREDVRRDHAFDPVQLRSFVAVAEALAFAGAAEQLGLSPSAVSQHVRKLETTCGRVLLERDTHRTALTVDGEAMLGFARTILDGHAAARDYFAATRPRGNVRFGIGEDLAGTRLPGILRALRQRYPEIDVELTVARSGALLTQLRSRALDVILAKRVAGGATDGARVVSRDDLVWLAAPGVTVRPSEPIPLVLYPAPSITRDAALAALERRGLPFRTACAASSLSGLHAAARAGMGVLPHARSLAPDDLLPLAHPLPRMQQIELVIHARRRTPTPAERSLIEIVTSSGAH